MSKLYRIKPCSIEICGSNACWYGEGNSGKIIELHKRGVSHYIIPFNEDEVLNWRGSPYCGNSNNNSYDYLPLWVEFNFFKKHIEKVNLTEEHKNNDLCPKCSNQGEWVMSALKCPNCWYVW